MLHFVDDLLHFVNDMLHFADDLLHFVDDMLHFVNDMLHFVDDLLRVISRMIGSNGAFHHSDQNMWKWIRIALGSKKQKKVAAWVSDAKKLSELSSGERRAVLNCGGAWTCESATRLFPAQFPRPPVLDTLSWPDNSCFENVM